MKGISHLVIITCLFIIACGDPGKADERNKLLLRNVTLIDRNGGSPLQHVDIPAWMNDPFFRSSLEPGVYEMISTEEYRSKIKDAPVYEKNTRAFETALKNVKKLHDAGVLIALGTDSGAQAIRAQGFSEHLELQLLVQAGLTPLEAITVATRNSARLLKIDDRFGTLEKR